VPFVDMTRTPKTRRENRNAYPPPRKRGRGTARSAGEGASDSTRHFRRKSLVEARAPSTTLLRRVVPLPRLRGGG
jgi:hypothetical protein